MLGKLVFVIGGARSGKSTFAQQFAQKTSDKVMFIATAEALDNEMEHRIEAHKRSRPGHWTTLECPSNIRDHYLKTDARPDVVLIDCITLLVSNLLMQAENNLDEDYVQSIVKDEFDGIMAAIENSDALWILVSNEVGSGLVPADAMCRLYRDMLGKLNQWMASKADEVYYMVAGIPLPIKQFRI